jgi:hypothetical protein
VNPRVKAGLAFAGVFMLGVVTGVGGARYGHARVASALLDDEPGSARRHAVLWAIDRKVDLDKAQRAKVEAILLAHEPELTAVQRTIEPKNAPIYAKAEDEIRAVLTPDQIAKFDELSRKFHERRQRAFDAAGPAPAASASASAP